MSNIRIKEFEVPAHIIAEIANIVTSNELENRITGVDEDETVVFMEVRYDKEEEGPEKCYPRNRRCHC